MLVRALTILTLVVAVLALTACQTGPVVERHQTTNTQHASPPVIVVE